MIRPNAFLPAIAAALLLTPATYAQETEPPEAYLQNGLAVLDCAPGAPAPENACLLRLTPGFDYSNTDMEPLGDTRGSFTITREGRDGFPVDLKQSETVILIDLSVGQGGGRVRSFDREKELIGDFITGLPQRSTVAIYGFSRGFEQIADFTTNRADLLRAVDGLDLEGTNTVIASSISQTISILEDREDVLFRNIVLVTDGVEEGDSVSVNAAISGAQEAGVAVSAMGMFWQGSGVDQIGQGTAYLRTLVGQTGGGLAEVILRDPVESETAVRAFTDDYATAQRRSGLIVPQGDPQPSVIAMDLTGQVAGNALRTRRIEVSYRPAVDPAPVEEDVAVDEPAEETIFGYPKTWVYGGAGLLGLLFLLGLLAALLKRGGKEDELPFDEPFDSEPAEPEAPPAAPLAPIRAFLVFLESGRRVPIRGDRVTVGRSNSNEIVVEHGSISRVHAQVHVNRDGGFSVTDLDSLNGTKIGDKKVEGTQTLRLGETVHFGKVPAKLITA